MKDKTFRGMITVIESMYNDSYKEEVLKFMWKRFKGLTDQNFEDCCKRLFDTFRPTTKVPLPLIPHFIDGGDFTEADKAITVIEKVKYISMKIGQHESVNFGDVALHRAIEYYGGWPVVAMWAKGIGNSTKRNFPIHTKHS